MWAGEGPEHVLMEGNVGVKASLHSPGWFLSKVCTFPTSSFFSDLWVLGCWSQSLWKRVMAQCMMFSALRSLALPHCKDLAAHLAQQVSSPTPRRTSQQTSTLMKQPIYGEGEVWKQAMAESRRRGVQQSTPTKERGIWKVGFSAEPNPDRGSALSLDETGWRRSDICHVNPVGTLCAEESPSAGFPWLLVSFAACFLSTHPPRRSILFEKNMEEIQKQSIKNEGKIYVYTSMRPEV